MSDVITDDDDEDFDGEFSLKKSNDSSVVKPVARDYKPDGILKRFVSKVQNIDRCETSVFEGYGQKIGLFISYSWHYRKEAVHEMARFLMQQNDFNVWIDMDNMSGSTYQSMAQGIDESDVVVTFFSTSYADSPNCRREIEYAANKNKEILPVRLEKGYRPDGWLLFIFKSQLRFDFCEGDNFHETAAKICDYVRSSSQKENVQRKASNGKASEKVLSVNFKCAGVPIFSKAKYYNRQDDETRILEQIKQISQNPEEGCLIVSGDGGVGKTTLMARLLVDDANHSFFVRECNFHRAVWINCFDWRESFDEKAFVDKILSLAKETEQDSERSVNFSNLQSVSSYFKKKNLRVAFILDDMFNYRLLQFFFEKQTEPPICFVVTRDAQTIIETHFDIVQKVERVEELSEEGIKEMLKNTFKLGKFLSDDQLYKMASRCCGLPLIASLMAARIANCDDEHEAKAEYRLLIQCRISDLKTQNRSFKTVANLFTFSLDQMDSSLRALYYAFLLFNPAEPISIFDLGVLWGFELDDGSRCGVRGVCRAFEKCSLVRRVKRKVLEPSEDAEDEGEFDDDTEDRFLVHQMLYEAALEKAKKEYSLEGASDAESLATVRAMIVDGKMGSADDCGQSGDLNVLCGAVKYQRRSLLLRIVKNLNGDDLAEFCIKRSNRTNGAPFLQFLFNNNKFRQPHVPGVDDVLTRNYPFRTVAAIFNRLIEHGGKPLLWRVVTTPTRLGRRGSLLTRFWSSAERDKNARSFDFLSLAIILGDWQILAVEMIWEETLLDSSGTTDLQISAFNGDYDQVVRLSECYEDGNTIFHKALQIAARRGHLPIVKFLAEKCPEAVESQDDKRCTPIVLAAKNNHLETVQYLYDVCPAAAKQRDKELWLPAHWCARNGHLECLHFFHKKEPSSLLSIDAKGNTTLMLAAVNGQLETVTYLCEILPQLIAKRDKSGQTAMTSAAINGRLATVLYLFDKYDSIHDRNSALMASCMANRLEVAKFILDNEPESAKMCPGITALMMAAASGNLEMVELLYDKSDATQKASSDGTTAIMVAAATGHLDIVQFLYFKNPSLIEGVDKSGETALDVATKAGHREVVKFLQDCLG